MLDQAINYNKLLIVGHPHADVSLVSNTLVNGGLAFAMPTQNQKIDASAISKHILNSVSKNVATLSDFSAEVSPVWSSLLLDFFLGNSDQPQWCWTDSNAVQLLNYFLSIDHQLFFVLVYDSVENYLSKIIFDDDNSHASIKEKLDNWRSYNELLVAFYLRNKERAILIDSEEFQKNAGMIANHLNNKGFKLSKSLVVDAVSPIPEQRLKSFLAGQCLKSFPHFNDFFCELKSFSLFSKKKNNNDDFFCFNAVSELSNLLKSFHQSEEENESLLLQRQQVEEENEALLSQRQQVEEENKSLLSQRQQVEEENKLLLLQQQQVEEENELLLLQQQQVEEENELLLLQQQQVEEENELLLLQLHQVQEELESFYLNSMEKKGASQEKIPNRYYGAADRVKNQLSYRWGSVLIRNSKSLFGLFRLPFDLIKERKAFIQYQKSIKNLPPVNQYADYYEVEKVKNHLSYKLGSVLLNGMKTPFGWLLLPVNLIKTVLKFKSKN